jgi:dolichol-phosphate mannosyltransferase
MVSLWREGHDVVCGVRRKRKEGPVKKFFYWSYYRILSALSEVEIVKDSGDFCLMDKRVVSALNSLSEKVRFNRGLRSWVGFKQATLEYERDRRRGGASKYSFADLYRLGTEGIVSSGTRPLKVVQLGAFLVGGLVLVLGTYSALLVFDASASRELVLISIGFLVTAVSSLITMLALHLIAGYLGRTYTEVKSRPPYLIEEEVEGSEKNMRVTVGYALQPGLRSYALSEGPI